jgi:glycosyltransferase involved in cell wall biosynthesis
VHSTSQGKSPPSQTSTAAHDTDERSTGDRRIRPVTVVIPTLNEVDRLRGCIESVHWAAEVIVADAGSSDGTVHLARSLGAQVIEAPGMTIAGQRNAAMDCATQPWVLAVDADERVSPELAQGIAAAIAAPSADAYRIHFRNRYLGAPLTRGGWGRDRHVRFSRAHLRWAVTHVHERLAYDGTIADLNGMMEHDSYRDLEHQLSKLTTYSAWGADDLHAHGKSVGVSHLLLRPTWRFVRCYFVQGAWREGARGFILAAVHGFAAFAKYALLWDLKRKAKLGEKAVTRAGAAVRSQSNPAMARTMESASIDAAVGVAS